MLKPLLLAAALVAAGPAVAAPPTAGSPPAASPMTVDTFLTRANALRAQGPMALMSPDFPILRAEAQAATAQLKAERDARRAKGLKPIACVPQGQSIGIMDMLDGLAALSPAQRRLPLKDGYALVIARRFPC